MYKVSRHKKALKYYATHLFPSQKSSSNKGIAVSILINLYKNKYKKIETIAIGDSPNDIPMLERVDYPVIVQKHNGSYDSKIKIPRIIKANGVGTEGWNKAVLNKFSKSSTHNI